VVAVQPRQAGVPAQPRRPRAKDVLGRYGEDLAAQHLEASGLLLLDRNWRCREGELDLVARDGDGTVVFVEVKTRSSRAFGEPSEAVGPVKARRLRRLAARWLQEHPGGPRPLRFDVVSIVHRQGEAPVVQHLRAAF
jgi:putative endonuclease